MQGTNKGQAFTLQKKKIRGRKNRHLEIEFLNANKEDYFYKVSKKRRKYS
jgi:hypothetical protein